MRFRFAVIRLPMWKAELGIHFRPARLEDAGQIAAIFRYSYGSHPHPCKDDRNAARWATDDELAWIVAVDGDLVAGCFARVRGRDGQVTPVLVVHPEYRGCGLEDRLRDLSADPSFHPCIVDDGSFDVLSA